MGDDPELSVTNDCGKVRGADGLYIFDGAIFPTSVGVNPSATITALAERNVREFIRSDSGNRDWPKNDQSPGAREYELHQTMANRWYRSAVDQEWDLAPPDPGAGSSPSPPLKTQPLGLHFIETMRGFYLPRYADPPRDDPRGAGVRNDEPHDVTALHRARRPDDPNVDPLDDDARYREREHKGCPAYPVTLTLDVRIADMNEFFADDRHPMTLHGNVELPLERGAGLETCPATGTLHLFESRSKPYGIQPHEEKRRRAHVRLAGKYTTRVDRPNPERFMTYSLRFASKSGRNFFLAGYKRIKDDPGMDAWRDTSSLFIRLYERMPSGDHETCEFLGAGVAHVDVSGFLFDQLPSMEVGHYENGRFVREEDPARVVWATTKFVVFFFGSLQRIYAPEVGSALSALFKAKN
jgi:hypothetical protein